MTSAILNQIPHFLVGVLMLVLAGLVLWRKPNWLFAEKIIVIMVGIIYIVGPTCFLIWPSLCYHSVECSRRSWVHVFSGLTLITGSSSSCSKKMVMFLPISVLLAGNYLYFHEHTSNSMGAVVDPLYDAMYDMIDMTELFVHRVIGIFMIVASIIRIVHMFIVHNTNHSDKICIIENIYAFALSMIGTMMVFATPIFLETSVKYFAWDGLVLTSFVLLFHITMSAILLTCFPNFGSVSNSGIDSNQVYQQVSS